MVPGGNVGAATASVHAAAAMSWRGTSWATSTITVVGARARITPFIAPT
jgi:hypothetical protein